MLKYVFICKNMNFRGLTIINLVLFFLKKIFFFLVLNRNPEQCPSVVSLLAESYNPHVRYGAAMALGIACAGTGLKVNNTTEATIYRHKISPRVDWITIESTRYQRNRPERCWQMYNRTPVGAGTDTLKILLHFSSYQLIFGDYLSISNEFFFIFFFIGEFRKRWHCWNRWWTILSTTCDRGRCWPLLWSWCSTRNSRRPKSKTFANCTLKSSPTSTRTSWPSSGPSSHKVFRHFLGSKSKIWFFFFFWGQNFGSLSRNVSKNWYLIIKLNWFVKRRNFWSKFCFFLRAKCVKFLVFTSKLVNFVVFAVAILFNWSNFWFYKVKICQFCSFLVQISYNWSKFGFVGSKCVNFFGFYVKIGQFCSFSGHNFIQLVKILVLQGQILSILQFSGRNFIQLVKIWFYKVKICQFCSFPVEISFNLSKFGFLRSKCVKCLVITSKLVNFAVFPITISFNLSKFWFYKV